MNLLNIFKSVISFFNTGIGIAIIGIIGVIIGSVISYLFNKNYQNKLLKNNILEKTLSELLEILIINLKDSAEVNSKKNSISDAIEYFKDKTEHTVNNKIQLDETFRETHNCFLNYEKNFMNILMHFETHQIILNEFINYHHKLIILGLEFIDAVNSIKDIYSKDIYVSLHKINLSKKYVDEIKKYESKIAIVLEEMQFYMQNITCDIQNLCYSKLFKGIKTTKDLNENYDDIGLVNIKKNSFIDFSKVDVQ